MRLRLQVRARGDRAAVVKVGADVERVLQVLATGVALGGVVLEVWEGEERVAFLELAEVDGAVRMQYRNRAGCGIGIGPQTVAERREEVARVNVGQVRCACGRLAGEDPCPMCEQPLCEVCRLAAHERYFGGGGSASN